MKLSHKIMSLAAAVAFSSALGPIVGSADAALPSFDTVSKDYTKVVVSDQANPKGLFNVWKRDKDAQVLAELPKSFAGKSFFIALTLSSGDTYAGLQSGDWVVQFRRYDDRIALIAPNLDIKATGDAESKASVKRLFTDRVLLDVGVVATGPSGGPVIDMDSLLVGNASRFFGSSVRVTNSRLKKIKSAKVFPGNVELAFEIVGSGGKLQTLHYSFSQVPSASSGFKPRKADQRVGYFTTAFSDLSKYTDEETRVRYINRWKLQKRDPKLKLSPPVEPIRFYVEHTAPVRYRRWIKAGVDYWNKAFEKVGIVDAIVIEYQDAQSKSHMEKDPEDVRYNFIRWLNNDIGTAIGPSRVHPETGEILDADIVLTDGWIRHFNFNYHDLMPKIAMEGASPELLAWLADHPSWDPRLRMAPAAEQHRIAREIQIQSQKPMAGFAMANTNSALLGDEEFDGLIGSVSQKNGLCMAASGRSMDLAMARMNWALSLMADDEAEKEKKKDEEAKKEADDKEESKEESESDGAKEDDAEAKKEDEEKADDKEKSVEAKKPAAKKIEGDLLDGMPEWFVGPLLADLVAHEVGHTLGLRHNFKGSALYTLDEINSKGVKSTKPFASTVMDYIPINYRYEAGDVQGDYAMIDIGPYDYWAIEYGYTADDKKLPEILKRCSEPELQYATDEDTSGPDPLARRYDFSADPLDFATEQVKLIKLYRDRILEKFVQDGDSWAKASRGYDLTLSLQTRSVSMIANWIGGVHVYRDKKGDPGDRAPLEVVPAEQQRKAVNFVIETTFRDEAYGLTPELLRRMSTDQWLDARVGGSADWPVHDRILGIQSTALTQLMNPTALRRVYDNEFRVEADKDALTLPELMKTVTTGVWTELDADCPEDCSARKPMISSLRRNLQREHTKRLIDLVMEDDGRAAAMNSIRPLARMELQKLSNRIRSVMDKSANEMDAYTAAHLAETKNRIDGVLEANYTLGQKSGGGGSALRFFFGHPEPETK